ncbi:MAG: hypothetical protein ACRDGV_10490, partial [Candidatus Limnocylindria bacterium]
MAEELRFFLRTAIYAAIVAVAYWILSYEPAGTVLLAALALAVIAFVAAVAAFARGSVGELRPGAGAPASRALDA